MNAIVRDFTATHCSDNVNMRVRLSWAATDPYAVVVSFPRSKRTPPWTFSRELLVWGLGGDAGVGDVRCTSDAFNYTITLLGSHAEEGMNADLVLMRHWVAEFLEATAFDPAVFEDVLDSELEQLFRETA
jgi:Streptomyces sporulation and cell division protein, SsgA